MNYPTEYYLIDISGANNHKTTYKLAKRQTFASEILLLQKRGFHVSFCSATHAVAYHK